MVAEHGLWTDPWSRAWTTWKSTGAVHTTVHGGGAAHQRGQRAPREAGPWPGVRPDCSSR